MTRMWKDGVALVLTLLVVLTFAATNNGWNVWLVGDNHHWAAVVMLLLGIAGCTLGESDAVEKPGKRLFAALGIAAFALGVIGIATGSLGVLALLAVDVAFLWTLATLRHVNEASARQPLAH